MTELEHAIKHIKTRADAWAVKEVTEALQSISERLDKALSQEPKSGKWINDKDDMPTCSKCGYIPPYSAVIDDYEYSNYCPNCGARMESEEQTEWN